MNCYLFVALFLNFFCISVFAQSAVLNVVIENVDIHTLGIKGSLKSSSIWIDNGVIKAIGTKISVPSNVTKIDGKEKMITPGLIDAYSQLGVVEIPSIESTADAQSSLNDISASFSVVDAFNADSMLIPITRVEGITKVLCAPLPGTKLFAGMGSWVHLGDSLSPGDYLIKKNAAMVLNMGETGASISRGSRAASLAQFKQYMGDVHDYVNHRAAYEQARRRNYSLSQLDLEALVPVYRGQMPLLVRADKASDIDSILDLKKQYPTLKWIIIGAAEGWLRAKELSRNKISVIIEPMVNNPYGFDKLRSTLENANRLYKEGVRVAMTYGEDPHNSRALRYAAGNAVSNGLPWIEGLKGITLYPSQIFGLSTGTLQIGDRADLVLWSGDPLEVTTVAEKIWIQGKVISMVTRQTLLRDRYMNLKADMPYAYRKPTK